MSPRATATITRRRCLWFTDHLDGDAASAGEEYWPMLEQLDAAGFGYAEEACDCTRGKEGL